MVWASLFPVFALIILGNLLKRYQLTNDTFLRTADRLVYFIFFPAMLFWKIGASGPRDLPLGPQLFMGTLAILGILYLLSLLLIRFTSVTDFQAGTFSQSCYRFNTYIGMAIVLNALGDEGVQMFGLLVGGMIPVINVLAVSTLIWFSAQRIDALRKLRLTLKALLANPLILACLTGLGYARLVGRFPPFIDNTLALISMVTLPLALLSIGAALTPRSVRGHFSNAFKAAGCKLALCPLLGFLILPALNVSSLEFKVAMIYLALPTSTSIYVLSAQLRSDTELASAAIVLSTVLSMIPLSWVLSL
ncbi:MAG: AEC family transporter [Desulfobacterales bacterium]|jgi:predicted permease